MGKPKKRTSHRKTGLRRSHVVVKLARQVNAKSPVKAYTTVRESAKSVTEAKAVSKPKVTAKSEKSTAKA